MRRTISDMVESVESAKENCALIGTEFTVKFLAYWLNCSETYAAKVIQYADGVALHNAKTARLNAYANA